MIARSNLCKTWLMCDGCAGTPTMWQRRAAFGDGASLGPIGSRVPRGGWATYAGIGVPRGVYSPRTSDSISYAVPYDTGVDIVDQFTGQVGTIVVIVAIIRAAMRRRPLDVGRWLPVGREGCFVATGRIGR